MDVRIVPTAQEHAASFRECLDAAAGERCGDGA